MSEAPVFKRVWDVPDANTVMLLHVAGRAQQIRPVCFEYSGVIRVFVSVEYLFMSDNC